MALAVPSCAQGGIPAGHYPGNQSRSSLSSKTGQEAPVSTLAKGKALVPQHLEITVEFRTRTPSSQAKAPDKRVRTLGTEVADLSLAMPSVVMLRAPIP